MARPIKKSATTLLTAKVVAPNTRDALRIQHISHARLVKPDKKKQASASIVPICVAGFIEEVFFTMFLSYIPVI